MCATSLFFFRRAMTSATKEGLPAVRGLPVAERLLLRGRFER